MALRALASINLAAMERNVARLRRDLAPGVAFCAVVKADGYGHGARACARAAQAAGATWLAVATAEEAAGAAPRRNRRADPRPGRAVARGARARACAPAPTSWPGARPSWIDWPAARSPCACTSSSTPGWAGWARASAIEAVAVAERVLARTVAGARRRDDPFRHRRRRPRIRRCSAGAVRPVRRPSCAAAARAWSCMRPTARPRCGLRRATSTSSAAASRSTVVIRCSQTPPKVGLEPALELRSYVAAVKRASPGDSAGYGRRFIAEQRDVAGHGSHRLRRRRAPRADQQLRRAHRRRALSARGDREHGQHHRRRGRPGGRPRGRGGHADRPRRRCPRQTAEDLARRLDTINYEVVCGISARVPRSYHRDGVACEP